MIWCYVQFSISYWIKQSGLLHSVARDASDMKRNPSYFSAVTCYRYTDYFLFVRVSVQDNRLWCPPWFKSCYCTGWVHDVSHSKYTNTINLSSIHCPCLLLNSNMIDYKMQYDWLPPLEPNLDRMETERALFSCVTENLIK